MRAHSFRRTVCLLGGLALLWSSAAQASEQHHAWLSLFMGALRSNALVVGSASWRPSVGAFATVPLKPPVAITMGAILESRRGSWEDWFPPGGHDALPDRGYLRKVSMGHLVFPLRIELGGGDAVMAPSFLLGVEAGYLLWANEVTIIRATGGRYGQELDLTSRMYEWELSAHVGARLSIRALGRHRCFLEATGFHGMTDLEPSHFSIEGSDRGFANTGVRFGAGITI